VVKTRVLGDGSIRAELGLYERQLVFRIKVLGDGRIGA
jgi:hypothetical protein